MIERPAIELRGSTWDHPRGWGGARAAAEVFARERPDVHVTWDVRTLQAFADHPVDELAAAYDLIILDHPSIGAAVGAGALLPLDEHLDAAFLDEQAASSVGRSHESYAWEGHQWALAIDAAAQVGAFRPDLLERAAVEVPRTWEEVVAASEALRARGLTMAIPAVPVDAICAFLGTCGSEGEEPLTSDDVVVSRDVGRGALRVLGDVVARSHPASTSWDPPTVLDRMAKDDAISYVPLAFGYANFGRPGFATHPLRFTAGPAGAAGMPSGTLGGAGLAVSASSAHAEAACAFAAFVARPDVQRTVYVEGGGQPGHRGAWSDPAINASTGHFFADTLGALDAAYLRPRYEGFLDFQDEAGDLVHRYLRDGGDPDAVLDALDASYRASLGTRAGAER
jgi:multiple sugar transport system substrate-binding protein